MAKLSIDEIEGVKDFMVGMGMLGQRGLINDRISDLDDIKEILRLKYHPMDNDDSNDLRDSIMVSNYSELMDNLKKQLNDVELLIYSIDFQEEFGELYKLSENKINQIIKKLKEMIERKRFPILTAGEAKAGKSTLVNLLLGCELMPMGLVTCTRMICEVRNSPEKRATFVMDDNGTSIKEVISLETNAMAEISRIVKQENSVKYQKGLFEYPVEFLDKFTCLVDSPGIGDTTDLDKITFGFLNENAPAFIFVLNATNSCGLNLKAKELISKARDELASDYGSFLFDQSIRKNNKDTNQMDKAIFILNHWDVVKSSGESKEKIVKIRQNIVSQIQTLWHESATEGTQIFFMSALQARDWLKVGLVQTDVIKLRKSLTNLVVKVYHQNFQNCLRVLCDILDYVERLILKKINTNIDSKYSRLYNKKHAEKLCLVLESIASNSVERKNSIIMKLKPQVELMIKSLTEHLRTEEFKNKIFCEFKKVIAQCKEKKKTEKVHLKADDDEHIDIISKILKKVLEKQMYDELRHWEEKTQQIEQLNIYLNSLFEEQIVRISNEIQLENTFISKGSLSSAWNAVNRIQIKPVVNGLITKVEQIFIISTITLLFPVVAMAGMLATPLIINHWFKSKRDASERQKNFIVNKDEYLKKSIASSLNNISEEYVTKNFFRDVLSKCMDHIEDFDSFIKLEISEKRQLIKDIENENRVIPEILRSLNILLRRIERCYGEYHLMSNKYLPDQLLTRPSSEYLSGDETVPMIDETISICQSSILFKSRRNKNVLLKMYSKKFTQQFARFQMQEIDILSTGSFQCILPLKHICYLEKEEKLLLVMENAECNLQKYLKFNKHLVPLTHNQNTPSFKRAFRFIVDVSKKLCTCLKVLHGHDIRMVHPDFRIDTVLVSQTGTPDIINVYVCDACSNLPTQRMHQRSGNIPAEVTELCFDMGGYTLENIYRLGIIFYEIAYFQQEPRLRSESASTLPEDFIDNDVIVSSIESIESDLCIDWNDEKHLKLHGDYNHLIRRCLSKHPQDRPSAEECLQILSEIVV